MMEKSFDILKSLLEPTGVLVLLAIMLFLNSWVFGKIKSVSSFGNFAKKMISFLIIFVGILIFMLSLPIDKTLKGQILSFLAIIISAGIALSSTTILGNLIAGIMNNSMKRFRNGDLINIGEYKGRVDKVSIFHTEIQLEDSNFITIPNLYIATHPVKLIRKNNTVISTSVSLGYDVSRIKIEDALKEAAISIGLKDPYVFITNLGDYSVVYKIHGFLIDNGKYFSTLSLLNGKVMDLLHEHGIEIVSPSFMNQRRVDEKEFIPKRHIEKEKTEAEPTPEKLIFDEAIKSEKIEKKKDYLKSIEEKQDQFKEDAKKLTDENEKKKVKESIKKLETLKTKVMENIEEQNKDKDDN